MKYSSIRHCRTLALTLLMGSGTLSTAHSGPPGHYHPDEVDEFDQVAMVSTGAAERSRMNIGGISVLVFMGACLGFALFQKDGGIWEDVSANR